MKIDSDKNGFLAKWQYVELARYIPSLKRVIREKGKDGTILYNVDRVQSYSNKYENTGIYTSIWRYNSQDISSAVRFGPLYFDIDNQDIDVSYSETKTLYGFLCSSISPKAISVFFTGKKGFHIECDPVCLGINPSNDLPAIYRYIANSINSKLELTCIDFSVYDPRRMWRLEGTKHQETGLYKTLLPREVFLDGIHSVMSYASSHKEASYLDAPFDYTSNEWYRNFVYEYEETKNKPVDILAHFNQYGSSGKKTFTQSEKIFQKDVLLNKCTAVKRLEEQAKTKHYLEHEARLFLCSILTYSEEAVQYLHEILSNCEDYNLSKSNAHINDWIKRREMGIGGRPYTCERANAVGVGCGQCSLDKKNKWVRVGDKYIETQEKLSPSPVRFAYKSLKENEENDANSRSR